MGVPDTRYAKTVDGVHIAYQVLGEGAAAFVLVNSAYVSNVEIAWEWDVMAAAFRWLAARGRLVLFDRRGTGLSDGVDGETLPTLEARMDDIGAVMDAAGLTKAVLFGAEDGAAQCFLFAATYPERTAGIVTFGAASRGTWAPDSPWVWNDDEWNAWLAQIDAGWGSDGFMREATAIIFPSKVNDDRFVRTYGRAMRHALSPGGALASERMYMETDVRHILPVIQAPALVTHSVEDRIESVQEGRYIADHIPGAVFVEIEGSAHAWWEGLSAAAPAVERFLASLQEEEASFDRMLATVLFTDIVGSTDRVRELGDRAWREVLERHHATARALLARYRGHEVETTGDGFFATFDGPARAIRCARAICEAMRPLGLEVRAGLHTGEVEMAGEAVRGIAVHIGARIAGLAGPSEVLVSRTVKDLTAGSGLAFADAGEHELKGVPERWHLYRVVDQTS